MLPLLVSSKVYRQLEFVAVGTRWLYSATSTATTEEDRDRSQGGGDLGSLTKVPNGREDIFADEALDLRSRRSLMKLLRFVADYESSENWTASDKKLKPFPKFLEVDFGLAPETSLQEPILALLHLPERPESITTARALPRLARHLRSIGVFGPGFAAVLPKWGGLAEIAQVACRASAVGGAVYVLGRGVKAVGEAGGGSDGAVDDSSSGKKRLRLTLTGGESVSTDFVVGCEDDLPSVSSATPLQLPSGHQPKSLCRSISIVVVVAVPLP